LEEVTMFPSVAIEQPAPLWDAQALLPTKEIGQVRLIDLRGSYVLLIYVPSDFLHGDEIVAYSNAAGHFRKLHTNIVFVSCDSVFSHLGFTSTMKQQGGLGGEHLAVPLVSDYTKSIAKCYGLISKEEEQEISASVTRGFFVICPEGVLKKAFLNDILSVDEAQRVVETLATQALICEGDAPFTSLTSTAPSSSTSLCLSKFLSGYWKAYKKQIKHSPILTKSITSCIIGLVGEVLGSYSKAQATGSRVSIDPRRMAAFGLYGLVVTGPVLHVWYSFLEQIMNDSPLKYWRSSPFYTLFKTLAKLIVDRAIFGPPFVLLTVAFIQAIITLDLKKAGNMVKKSYVAVLLVNQKFWVIAQVHHLFMQNSHIHIIQLALITRSSSFQLSGPGSQFWSGTR
jgi:alkyl hydroperoxide reductase subunit AhpC